ncbi:hypothetical protein SLS62_011065 [Diatrype stigma]|uniref:Major facilitator superfamily (MFS) profile domain-containing protein n=1 Tax=Diatrype stigma TaxID=117547 RepID=A0AAN9U5B5_9PEZI
MSPEPSTRLKDTLCTREMTRESNPGEEKEYGTLPLPDLERDAGVGDDEKKRSENPSVDGSSKGEIVANAAAATPDTPSSSDDAASPQQVSEGEQEAGGKKAEGAPVEPEATRTKFETNLIVLALCSALFLAALDVTIVTTAIPTIAAEFRSPLGYTWVGSAYLLANAVSVPSWGKISDIWGRKPILLLAVAVFFVGSLLCAVSVSMAMLIAGRAVQGVGGGGIVVQVNICVTDLFSMRRRGTYVSCDEPPI